jgi:hypothetical protein
MTQLLPDWNAEKISRFAPDLASAKAGQKLAKPTQWQRLGHDDATAWGEFQGSGRTPYQVQLDLTRLQNGGESAYHCTCPSRKYPCKHVLGLVSLAVDQPNTLPPGSAPEFVAAHQAKLEQRTQNKETRRRSKPTDPQQQAKTMAERQQKIMAGLQELELWLLNMMRHGLADAQLQNRDFWEAKAARMVDAQAPGLATWLRSLAALPGQRADWVEPLLNQLGRLYLLIQGFKRFDQLSPETQADLRAVVGWYQKREEIAADTEPQRDHWLVLGRQVVELDYRLRSQRLWLHGQATGREALILDFAFGEASFETNLTPGTSLDAELIYYPSRRPLRALVSRQLSAPLAAQALTGTPIRQGLAAYAQALASNPWLPQFPLRLAAVIPVQTAGRWLLRERDGTGLPLADHFTERWSLLALSGGQPLPVAGEWDGTTFLPLSTMVDGRFIDFQQMGGG